MKLKFTDEQGAPRVGLIIAAAVGIFVVIPIFFSIIGEFYQVVEPANKGLVIKGGALQEEALNNGFYMKMPFWTDIVPVFIGTLSTDEDKKGNFKEDSPFRNIQPLSKDGQVLEIDVQINYSVVDIKKFRETTGNIDPRIIEQLSFVPTIRKLIYDYVSEYTWKGLIQEGDRQEFGQRIFRSMTDGETTRRVCREESRKIDETTGTEIIVEAGCEIVSSNRITTSLDYGIAISAINFKKIRPNKKIIAAVEEAQAKEQEVKIAAQEAAIATEKANKQIEQKRGETESKKLEVDVNAYAIRVQMEEEAKGIVALAEAEKARALALQQSTALVEYKKLDIEMVLAEAQLEFARHYKGEVPNSVQIIGTDEAESMKIFIGLPAITVGTE